MRTACLALAALVVAVGTAAADPSPKALSLFRKALQENTAGNHGAALKLYFDAHKEDPEVLALDDEGLLQNASQWLASQLDAAPDDVHAHFQMAELKMLQGLERQALGHFEKVVKLEPTSPLANLAKPLIQDLKDRIGARPNPAASGGGGGGATAATGSSAQQINDLRSQISQLTAELGRAKDEIGRLKSQLSEASSGGGEAQAELDKLRKEFDAYKAEAEQWKLYKTLYFADPRNVQNLRNLSGS